MHDCLKSRVDWLTVSWFLVVILLVLPGCGFQSQAVGGSNNGPNLKPGNEPRSSAIFCDIVKERRCATPTDLEMGIRLSAAAVALNTGSSGIGIDDSPAARGRCSGQPEAVIFQGAFPKGYSVCVNCGEVVGTTAYPNATAACVAQCEDFVGTVQADGSFLPDNPPSIATRQFCESNAKVSTNAPLNECFAGACTSGGTLLPDFADPRRIPEPVIWTDLIGMVANDNTLIRTAPTTNPPLSNAGAASSQWIAGGDAYVEFSVPTANHSQLLGLSEVPAGCASPCPDTNPSPNDIGFGIVLFNDGRFYVAELGTVVAGPGPGGSFGTYAAGERFRVTAKDSNDGSGTATITYSRIQGACTPGSPCNEQAIRASSTSARYPLRVDATTIEQNASMTDVRVVRIR
jgi:hypothetical protein